MDSLQVAANSSDPLWEEPRWSELHTIRPFNIHQAADDNNNSIKDEEPVNLTDRAKILDNAATELNSLCASNAPLPDVEDFFAKWVDSTSSNRIQLNALAWFNDSNALRCACVNNNRDVVRFLLGKGIRPTSMALLYATAKWKETGDNSVIKLLVNSGWNINEPLNDQTPPLISLLVKDHELVQWCLSLGADPNASSLSGNTVMQRAVSHASLDTLKLLVDHGGSVLDGALVAQASYFHNNGVPGRLEHVRFLLDEGAPINAFYMENQNEALRSYETIFLGRQTALHFAIWGGKKDMAKLLLDSGADKDIATCSVMKTNGQTISPLELAKKFGFQEIVALLEDPKTT